MTNIITLDGNIREELGSSFTRKLRKIDRLPAVIYSDNGNIFVDVDIKKFETEYFKGNIETKIVEIKTAKKTYKTTVYQVELNPVSDRPRHIDFMSLENKKEVKVFVPIKIVNKDKSIGMKRNGFLNIVKRKIQLLCEINSIPENIELDIIDLKLQEAIMSSKIKLPAGCKFVNKKEFMVLNILGRNKEEETATPVAATTTATATPAAAAPAATKENDKKK